MVYIEMTIRLIMILVTKKLAIFRLRWRKAGQNFRVSIINGKHQVTKLTPKKHLCVLLVTKLIQHKII